VITPTPAPTVKPTAKPPATGPNKLTVERIASGLSSPIGITNARDGSARLFIVQRGGQVRVIDADGVLSPTPFVDLSGRIVSGGEQGLLGLAFHPNFAANGRLFVDYTRSDGNGAWEDVVSELNAPGDRSSADPSSERVLLAVPDPYTNHNGGQLAFGPDGYLYVAMGDGGSGGDPHGNGQNRQALLGKILRIDVNGAHAAGKEYAIPNTNPYAPGGVSPGSGLPEIWAYGLRNPWRFSFDRANGDLYIGDVGQDTWEEIDRQAAGSRGGLNYGWNAFEGRHCFLNCAGVSYVPPIAEYSHASGCSVTGGYVYRGTAQPALKGIYLFSDYCAGTLWTFPAGTGNKAAKVVASTGLSVASFGEGEDGEIYLADIGGGRIYRVVVSP
jgi:glucose/arabinose dehydrogenase